MAQLNFDGRTAIVTGAGRGMGRTHALALAARGARVVVNDSGGSVRGEGASAAPADDVVAEIRDAGGEAVANYDAVGSPEAGAALVKTALDAFGSIDILVNNAGIVSFQVPFEEETPEQMNRQLEVHTRGAWFTTQAAWPHLTASTAGRVVNITSNHGMFGAPFSVSYGVAKGGTYGLTRCLAAAVAKTSTRVNAVCPLAWTRMPGEADETPFTIRMQSFAPEYVSALVTWLSHEDCEANGEVYTAGMGRFARVFVGVTAGIQDPDATPERVRDAFDAIRDEEGYTVPANAAEEMAPFFADTPAPS